MKPNFSACPLVVMIMIGVFMLAGCSTVESRIALRSEAWNKLPQMDRARIMRGDVRSGDSQAAVWIAYGEPGRTEMRNQKSVLWVYERRLIVDRPGTFNPVPGGVVINLSAVPNLETTPLQAQAWNAEHAERRTGMAPGLDRSGNAIEIIPIRWIRFEEGVVTSIRSFL